MAVVNLRCGREGGYDGQITGRIKPTGVRGLQAAVSGVCVRVRVFISVIETSAAPFY